MPYNNKPRYSYSPHHGMWRVFRNEYTKNTCTGEPIEEYRTKEEARKRVYELNGWKYENVQNRKETD